MYMVEITEDKVCGLYDNIEKGLKYIGKAMQCIDELKSESRHGHRDYDEDEDERFGERRGMSRRGMSRYDRY